MVGEGGSEKMGGGARALPFEVVEGVGASWGVLGGGIAVEAQGR